MLPLSSVPTVLHTTPGAAGLAGVHDVWPFALVPPPTHGVHAVVRALEAPNVPAAHNAQLFCLSLDVYFPAGHVRHCVVADAEYFPLGHDVHALPREVWPSANVVYSPGRHDTVTQLMASELEYFPPGHTIQLACPMLGWYCPAVHDLQVNSLRCAPLPE